MKRITNCVGYVAPKAKFAALKCDCGFAQSYVSGGAGIINWEEGEVDGADE